jgi:hypothetical protein
MSGMVKYDRLRATPKWRKTGARHDCALINGTPHNEFVRVFACFTIHLLPATYRVALVRRFRFVGRHPDSDYIQLAAIDHFDFVFIDTIIRMVHILPPSTYNPHFTVQDLQNPDIHLRLESLS